MLNYEDVKRWKRDLMLADPEFLTGRGRLESVEFHTAERVYLAGVVDGGMTSAMLTEAMTMYEPGDARLNAVAKALERLVEQLKAE